MQVPCVGHQRRILHVPHNYIHDDGIASTKTRRNYQRQAEKHFPVVHALSPSARKIATLSPHRRVLAFRSARRDTDHRRI